MSEAFSKLIAADFVWLLLAAPRRISFAWRKITGSKPFSPTSNFPCCDSMSMLLEDVKVLPSNVTLQYEEPSLYLR